MDRRGSSLVTPVGEGGGGGGRGVVTVAAAVRGVSVVVLGLVVGGGVGCSGLSWVAGRGVD